MNGLKTSVVLLSMVLLIPGVYGLDFKFGASNGMNGGSEALQLNGGPDSSVSSVTMICPDDYENSILLQGSGPLDFDQTFDSLNGGEHVRLTAKMLDSNGYTHSYDIEKREDNGIRVSQSLLVDQGKYIENYAEAWNSLGLSAKVGIKVPAGSLYYESYGEATDEKVIADQKAAIPEYTRFSVFAEATGMISSQELGSTMRSSKPLNAMTSATATPKRTKLSSIASRNTLNTNSIIR